MKATLGFLLGLSTAIVIWLGPSIKRAIFHRDHRAPLVGFRPGGGHSMNTKAPNHEDRSMT